MISQNNIQTAVDTTLRDSAAGRATYGDMNFWDTRAVTSMDYLFCAEITYRECTETDHKQEWTGHGLSHW